MKRSFSLYREEKKVISCEDLEREEYFSKGER